MRVGIGVTARITVRKRKFHLCSWWSIGVGTGLQCGSFRKQEETSRNCKKPSKILNHSLPNPYKTHYGISP